MGLQGEHQKINAAVALKAAEIFLGVGPLRGGLASTRWAGRLETVSKKPLVLIDGAHNLAGFFALANYLRENHKDVEISLFFGVMKDKDWRAMMTLMAPLVRRFILVRPEGERALDLETMARFADTMGWHYEIGGGVGEAFNKYITLDHQLWVAAGSLYMIGEVRKLYGISND